MVRRVVISLVAGLLATFVVQAACSIVNRSLSEFREDYRNRWSVSEDGTQVLSFHKASCFGSTAYALNREDRSTWEQRNADLEENRRIPPSPFTGPSWVRQRLVAAENTAVLSNWQTVILRGWPMRSAWQLTIDGKSVENRSLADGISLVPWLGRSSDPKAPNALQIDSAPIAPIWSGLAFNTGFYALAFFGIVTIAPKVRTSLRRRRGRCGGCGYELRQLGGCPECGEGS
ncbi:MAG: hypothetical protein HEQ23_06195 [Tepidisphaera sp.]